MADDPEILAPRANPDLTGHEKAEQILINAWQSSRFPHGWLISGPKGIGKATLAYRFARFILAGGKAEQGGLFGDAPPSLALSANHPVFQRTAAAGHADLVTIERTVNPQTKKLRQEISVDDVRAAGRFTHLTASEGGWRAVIVDTADEMNRNAANAILKMLEEPPPNVVLLLLAHAPGRLLPTIRSRCRSLRLDPLTSEQVSTLLRQHKPGLSQADADVLAALGEGSIGNALRLEATGGLELYRELVRQLWNLQRLDIPAVHALGDKLARGQENEAFGTFTWLLNGWLARLIKAAARKGGATEFVPGEAELIENLIQTTNLAQWMAVWENVTELFARADRVNLDRKQVIVSAFMSLQETAARP